MSIVYETLTGKNWGLDYNHATKRACSLRTDGVMQFDKLTIKIGPIVQRKLADDTYSRMEARMIPYTRVLKQFKDHTLAADSHTRNAESFGARQVQALVDRKLGGVK